MPVPQYVRQVSPGAPPTPRVQPELQTPDVQQPFAAAGRLAEDSYKMAQSAKTEADTAWAQTQFARLSKAKNDLIYGKDGFSSQQGGKALESVGEFSKRFASVADEVEAAASNENQRAMVRKLRQQEETEYMGSLQRHTAQETMRLKDQVHASTVEALTNDAVLNFPIKGKVTGNVARLESTIRKYTAEKGMPKEWADAEVLSAKSKVHTNIISRLIATGDAKGAMEWNSKYGADISNKGDRLAVDKGIEIVGKQARIESSAASILADKTDEAAAIQTANETVADPDELKAVKKVIRDKFAEAARTNWKVKSQTLDAAYDTARQTKSMPDALTLSKMSDSEVKGLEEYVGKLKTGLPLTTEDDTYYKLLDMATSPETQKEFLRTHLQQSRGKLSDERYKELADLQTGLLNGDKKATNKVWGLNSRKQMVQVLVRDLKLSKDKSRAFAENLEASVVQQETALERPLTKDELQRTFDDLAIKAPRTLWVDKPVGTYKFKDLPGDFVSGYEKSFESKYNRKPTEEEAVSAYQKQVKLWSETDAK